VAVPGQLTVGTGAGPVIGVFAVCEAPNQTGNEDAVIVGANGELALGGYSDTIASLQLRGGHVNTGNGVLTVTNNITCTADPDGSTISGFLRLAAPTTLLNVQSGALLNLRANVSSGPANTELRKFGAGELRLHGTNAYSAMTRLVEGTTRVLNFGGLGAGDLVRLEGGQLVLNNAAISNKTLVAWEPATLVTEDLTSRWVGDVSLLGTIDLSTLGNSTFRFNGRMTGAGGWRKTGPGSWRLEGRIEDVARLNTFNGGVRVEEGTMHLSVFLDGSNLYTLPGPLIVGTSNGEPASVFYGWQDQLADNAALVVEASGEVVDPDDLIGTLSGAGQVSLRGVTFRVGGTSVGTENSSTFAGRIAGGATSQFIKTGGGTLTLTGTNSFVGPTEVRQGTLLVHGELPTATASRPGEMTVHPGATLGGNGLVRELVANDANISPGASAGILTVETLTLNAGSQLNIELNGPAPGAGYDRLATTSRVRLDATAPPQLRVTPGYSPGVSDTFLILDNGGGAAITGTFAGLPEGAEFNAGHVRFRITYLGGTGNDVVLTVTQVGAPPSLLTAVHPLPGGNRRILGLGQPGLLYTIEATPHLNPPIPWSFIGTAPAAPGGLQPGLYEFLDTNAPGLPMRFYRAVSP
jgi:autotransporter-associated beta strand protein